MHVVFRVGFFLAGVLAAIWVFYASMRFYGSATPNIEDQRILIGYAAISGFVKVAFPFALTALALSKWIRGFGWLVVVACVCFDILGVSGFLTMTRGANVEAKKGEAVIYKELSAEVRKLRKLADDVANVRPTGVIQTELKSARAQAPNCMDKRNAHLESCQVIYKLLNEEATALDRDKRENDWTEAKAKLDNTARPNEAASNPLAAGVRFITEPAARYFAVSDPDIFVDLFLRVLTVLISEGAPPLCTLFALHKPPPKVPAAPARRAPGDPPAKRRARSPPADVLAALQAVRAGTVTGDGLALDGAGIRISNRALAAACGVSASRVNAVLRDLVDAGKVIVRSGPGGTYVEIL